MLNCDHKNVIFHIFHICHEYEDSKNEILIIRVENSHLKEVFSRVLEFALHGYKPYQVVINIS